MGSALHKVLEGKAERGVARKKIVRRKGEGWMTSKKAEEEVKKRGHVSYL